MQKVNVQSSAATVTVSPVARVFRTIAQSFAAFAAAEPILIAGLGFTGQRAAEIAAIVSSLVAIVSTVQNLAEHFGVIPVAGAKAPAAK